jgi:hypothetical protein
MRYITAFARFLGTSTDVLLTKTLESAYTQCRTQALRAIGGSVPARAWRGS